LVEAVAVAILAATGVKTAVNVQRRGDAVALQGAQVPPFDHVLVQLTMHAIVIVIINNNNKHNA